MMSLQHIRVPMIVVAWSEPRLDVTRTLTDTLEIHRKAKDLAYSQQYGESPNKCCQESTPSLGTQVEVGNSWCTKWKIVGGRNIGPKMMRASQNDKIRSQT